MAISRDDKRWQVIIVLCVCIFNAGAYFVFDAPAALQRYLQAAYNYSTTEYMDLYFWYSAPNIVTCILAGLIIDNIGRRIGGIIFCSFVAVGQLIFSAGMGMSNNFIAILGRMVIGAGVETLAVCSSNYLTWWTDGSSLKNVAFGAALAIWRCSSSISLMTVLPMYHGLNEVSPQDGGVGLGDMKSCTDNVCYNNEGSAYYDEDNDKLLKKILPHAWNQSSAFLEDTSYYCLDRRFKEVCEPKSLDSKFIKNWQNGDQSMCSFEKLTDEAEKFIEDAGIKKYGCLRFEKGAYVMDETKCGCLDEWFTSSWKWYDENEANYRLNIEGKPHEITTGQFRDAWYWSRSATFNFGEFLQPEIYHEKQQLFLKLNKRICEAESKVPADFERYNPRTDPSNNLTNKTNDFVYRKMIDGDASVRTVTNFARMMSSKNVYAKECSSKSSLLAVIPEADNKPRVAGITKCYFIMAAVSSVSMIFAFLLFFLDGKAVRIHEAKLKAAEKKENSETEKEVAEEESTKTTFKEMMTGFKESAFLICRNDKVIALYLQCICFYVGVFTFISQASTFFNEYHGIQAVVAGSITGAIYTLAVPLNFACGALVSSVGYQQGFLALAFVLSTLAHFIMMWIKSSVAAYAGVVLLAFGYSFIGSTMWPLAGELLPDKYNGQVYGFMYAFQQAGMTIASKFVGYLKDQGGWLALQMFFTILQLVGLGLSLYLISRIGLHSTTAGKKTAEDRTEEQIPMKEAEEKENTKEEN